VRRVVRMVMRVVVMVWRISVVVKLVLKLLFLFLLMWRIWRPTRRRMVRITKRRFRPTMSMFLFLWRIWRPPRRRLFRPTRRRMRGIAMGWITWRWFWIARMRRFWIARMRMTMRRLWIARMRMTMRRLWIARRWMTMRGWMAMWRKTILLISSSGSILLISLLGLLSSAAGRVVVKVAVYGRAAHVENVIRSYIFYRLSIAGDTVTVPFSLPISYSRLVNRFSPL